jgi:hypothetical protein
MEREAGRQVSPTLVAIAGWLVPGLGYRLIGERSRAYIAGITIVLTFLAGLLIGGIRVIDVPGYDVAGEKRIDAIAGQQVWRLRSNPLGEVFNKPWYIAQSLAGPMNMVATGVSLWAAPNHRASTARIFDIGTLYTAVAGMLNLLVIIDATYRAANQSAPREEAEAA